MARASSASASGIAAGAREILRMWSRCSFSVTSKHSTSPDAERAAITEISRSNGTKASRIADLGPRSSRAGGVRYDVERRGVRIRRKHVAAEPEARCRHRQHPAQLPAAEDSNGVARL